MEGRCEKDTGSNIKKQQSEIDIVLWEWSVIYFVYNNSWC